MTEFDLLFFCNAEIIFAGTTELYQVPNRLDHFIHNGRTYVVDRVTWNFDELEIRIKLIPFTEM